MASTSDSFRFLFDNPGDDDDVIDRIIASLGDDFERAWKRIRLADALFVNTDRHMRNFGMIRSSETGELLRLAPNFDNNLAYLANPGGRYSEEMLKLYMRQADEQEIANLKTLCQELTSHPYLHQAYESCRKYL